MKKNLLTASLRDQGNKSYMLRLCTIFLFSFFCNFYFNAAETDSANFQKDQQSIIYIIGSTQITGSSQFSNAHIYTIASEDIQENLIETKSPKTTVIAKIVTMVKERDVNLKVVQEKINRNVSTCFNSSSQDRELMKFTKAKNNFSAIITDVFSFKYTSSIASNEFQTLFFRIMVPKHKYYVSFSYLQHGKLKSSTLRAPPGFL